MDKQLRDEMKEIHIMPTKDCVEHTEGMDCICSPEYDGKNQWNLKEGIDDKVVIVHRCVFIERQ